MAAKSWYKERSCLLFLILWSARLDAKAIGYLEKAVPRTRKIEFCGGYIMKARKRKHVARGGSEGFNTDLIELKSYYR